MRKEDLLQPGRMPWENTWLAAPTAYMPPSARLLKTAGVPWSRTSDVKRSAAAPSGTPSSRSRRVRARPRMRSLPRYRSWTSSTSWWLDDDMTSSIRMDVEWAIATRVQGDKDIMIVTNARAKPLRSRACRRASAWCRPARRSGSTPPSPRESRASTTSASPMPTPTALGSTTTSRAKPTSSASPAGTRPMCGACRPDPRQHRQGALYYTDIAERFAAYDFRTVARALGHLHATEKLWQDARGRMCVRGSENRRQARFPGQGGLTRSVARQTRIVPASVLETGPGSAAHHCTLRAPCARCARDTA